MLRSGLGIVALTLALLAADARADSVLETYGFNLHSGPTGAQLIGIDPFDESFGTLTKVTVDILGQVQAGIRMPLALGPHNTPYSVEVGAEIRHDFDRLTGQFFDFGGPARTQLLRVEPTTGHVAIFTTPFRYSFVVDAQTDLTGGNINPDVGLGAIPPFWVQALLSDFVPTGPADLNQTVLKQEIVLLGGGTMAEWIHSVGSITVSYRFDPPEPDPDPPPPIPEPATLVLLVGGGAVVVACRRRRRD